MPEKNRIVSATSNDDEEITNDDRDNKTPSEVVQQKLEQVLSGEAIPVSLLYLDRKTNR
jgi:hypothetical protein